MARQSLSGDRRQCPRRIRTSYGAAGVVLAPAVARAEQGGTRTAGSAVVPSCGGRREGTVALGEGLVTRTGRAVAAARACGSTISSPGLSRYGWRWSMRLPLSRTSPRPPARPPASPGAGYVVRSAMKLITIGVGDRSRWGRRLQPASGISNMSWIVVCPPPDPQPACRDGNVVGIMTTCVPPPSLAPGS